MRQMTTFLTESSPIRSSISPFAQRPSLRDRYFPSDFTIVTGCHFDSPSLSCSSPGRAMPIAE
jgi:hypothetical protein